jgi:hypothetical protein
MDELDDQLRQRLARLDPMSGAVSTDPATSATAHDLMETIMETTESRPTHDEEPRNPRALLLLAAAAVAVIALAVGAYAIVGGDDDDSAPQDVATEGEAPTELALTLEPSDPMTQICIAVDATVLAPVDLAFGGTIGQVTESSVTIDVDHWYKGGDADVVTLEIAEGGNEVALDGVAFVSGERFLVTATGTTVNTCGLSGPASPEFEALFDEAFSS